MALADDEAIEELKSCLWKWKRSGTNEAASTQASSWMFHNTAAGGGSARRRFARLDSQDASVVCVHVSIGVTNFWSFRRDKLLLLATVVKKVAS